MIWSFLKLTSIERSRLFVPFPPDSDCWRDGSPRDLKLPVYFVARRRPLLVSHSPNHFSDSSPFIARRRELRWGSFATTWGKTMQICAHVSRKFPFCS